MTRPLRSVCPLGRILGQNEGAMAKEVEVGDKAPDVTLSTGAHPSRLSGLKGKLVVLYFYPKDDTSGCTAEAIAFNALKPQFEAAGATIMGISPDSGASHDKFRAKHNLALDLAADPD